MVKKNLAPNLSERKPPTAQDGPGSGFKRTNRWVDFTFGYGDTAPIVAGPAPVKGAAPVAAGAQSASQGVPVGIGEPRDFDENFPVSRPDVPELSEGVTPEMYDNSVLGGFVKFMDNIFPDDLGGMLRGESGWLSNVPLYEETVGTVLGAQMDVGSSAVDAINWGADQMNHLGSALVSWLPGGIQTLDWEQAQDVSFGQAFVSSMGQTAGRLERGEAEVGDWMMLPFSLISLGAAQIDPDNIAQDADFNVLNQEQLQKAFGSGAGMYATGGLDAAWLVAADPLILAGGASTVLRLGAKGTKFGGLTNQALRKVEQVNRFSTALADDAAAIAELGVDGARAAGRVGAEGENLIAAMEGKGSDLATHVWATGENASRQKTIISFLSETSVDEPQRAADLVSALAGHAPSWRKIREYDIDLYDRLSLANSVDNLMGQDAVRYGDALIEDAQKAFNNTVDADDAFINFERQFGTNLDYSDDAARAADEGKAAIDEAQAALPDNEIAGQFITRGGARVSPQMVRAANAWRKGKAKTQFAPVARATAAVPAVSERGHYVYDFIEKTSSSRPITVIRWVGQGTPNGIIFLKGDSGERSVREVTNWLRKSPLTPDESAVLLNKFISEKEIAAKALVLQEMERAAVLRIAEQNNLTVQAAENMFNAYNAKRAQKLDSIRKTKTKFYVDEDTRESVVVPDFYAEIDAAVPMLDTKMFSKIVKNNKITLGASEATNALDIFNTVWKVSVLLRLGYTQRNIAEGFMRSVAVIGLAATNPKAFVNLPVNAWYYAGMKRGIRSARKTEKDLNRAIVNLTAAREIVAESLTKKGNVRKGKAEQLAQARQRETAELEKIDALTQQLRDALEVVRYKNSKRKRTGVGANEVAPGVYLAGAFDGSEGQIARLVSSADRTTRNTIQSNAQRRIEELDDTQNFDTIDPSKLTAKQMQTYWTEYAMRINRRYMNDPVGKMILADRPISEIRAFFNTPEGKRYWDELQATGGATPQWQDVDQYLAETIRRLNYEVPQGSKLRELAVKGEELFPGDVAAAMAGRDLPWITGRLAEDNGRTIKGWAKQGFNFGIEESMRWLGSIPETNLLRHPFYNAIYKSRQRELYELAAGQGQNVGSAAVKAKINRSARADALRATNDTMYTIQEFSNAAALLRFISPFFPAWENSLRTWGRIVYQNPAILGVGNILWNIPNNLGWVVDENGNKVERSNFFRDENNFIIWPEPLAELARKDFGPFTPGEALMTRQQGFNLVFPGGEWWFPGVGPMTQIPTALILRGKPEDQEIIKQALGENLYRQIVPGGNPNTDLVDSLLPTVARRVKQMWSGESSDSAYLTMKNTMIEDAYITAQLEGRTLSEKDLRELNQKADDFWKWQITNAVVGFTQSAYKSPYKLQRDEWNKLIDDQSLTYQQKLEKFMDKFGGSDAFLAITRSASETETQLKPNLRTWQRIVENKDLVDQLYTIDPKLVGMFGNMGSFDDPFSYAVYGEFAGTQIGGKPIRSQMTPRELVEKNQIADGWREWNLLKDAAENRVVELGLSSLQVKEAQGLRDMLKAAEADLTVKYPAWGIEKESYEANWPKFIQGARMMVQNADLVDEDSTINALNQYLEIREAIATKLATVDNDEARSKIKQMGYAAAFELRQSDIGFADFYDQYLASDDFREI